MSKHQSNNLSGNEAIACNYPKDSGCLPKSKRNGFKQADNRSESVGIGTKSSTKIWPMAPPLALAVALIHSS